MNFISAKSRDNIIIQNLFWIMLIIAFIVAYLPVWKHLISTWLNDDNYSHGFAIVPLTLYIIWHHKQRFQQYLGAGNRTGLYLIFAALSLYIFSTIGEIKTVSAFSMILTIAGTIFYLGGFNLLKFSLYPLLLLCLMIPVPSQLLAALTIPLQLIVTNFAGFMAKTIGIPLLIQGNLIHIPNQTFEIVQACSGVRSIMTFIALGAFLGYFTFNAASPRLLLIASALPIAIFVNSIRILLMVFFAYRFEIDLLQGKSHTIFGIVLFVFSLSLFLLTQKYLALWHSKKEH